MPTCAVAVLQPDGSLTLRLDPTAMDVSNCAYVVLSGSDAATSVWTLSREDGASFSAGIVSVWFTAFCVKQLFNLIRGSHSNEST
jgi:hypothetical protein